MAAAPRAAPVVHINMHCRAADGFMALAGVEGTVRGPATVCLQTVRGGSDPGDFLILLDLVEKLGQHPSPVRSNRWRLPARHLRRRWW
jgi:hypothetical protein